MICPVRGCGAGLVREERRLICEARHSFDVAKSGYVNLLQPQDKKSKQPGDTAAAVAGRRRLHELGVTGPLFEAIAAFAGVSAGDTVLDAGCGEGFYLGSLVARSGCEGSGVDISIPAVDAAARKYPAVEWVVANADRQVPYAAQSFSLVLSITARMNAPAFRRVLRHDGRLLVAIPAPDDLVELRGPGRSRVERTVETFAADFSLVRQDRVTTSAELEGSAVEDIRHAIYRPLHSGAARAMRVTFSLDLLLFSAK